MQNEQIEKEEEYQTIEQDWPRFYREFPEIYDRFSIHSVAMAGIVSDMFELDNKVVLDVGSGTGVATLELAKRARFVIALEPEQAMMKVAVKKIRGKGIDNVVLVHGVGQNVPLATNSVDASVSFFTWPLYHSELSIMEKLAEVFVFEAERVVKPGGLIVTVAIPPFWYGGELAPVILGPGRTTEQNGEGKNIEILARHDFEYRDVFVTINYCSAREAVETYGFIFGRKAIDYLISHNMSSIRWKLRINYRRVE